MTVQTEVSRSGPYAGAGTTGPFTVGFRFLADSHLRVIRTSAAGVDTDLVLTTDYSVTGAGAESGTVTLAVALPIGASLTIIRDVPFTQEADYVDNDSFPAESHEAALDKLTMQTQQIREAQDRSLTLSPTSDGVSAELPAPIASNILGWNSAGNGLVNYDPTGLAGIISYGSFRVDVFNGDGTTIDFPLTADALVAANCDVVAGGVSQTPDVNYEYLPATKTIRFKTGAPPIGVANVFVRYGSVLDIGYAAAINGQTAVGTSLITASDQAAARAAIGAVSDGGYSLTGAINDKRSTVAMTATTSPIWVVGTGKIIDGTGTPSITNFPAAPQAGAQREVYPAVGTTITHGGSISVQGGATVTAEAGDKWIITATTATTFHVVIVRNNGAATVGSVYFPLVPTTSGTAKLFSGIPSWATEIELCAMSISTNGTNSIILTIGSAGGLEVTGYVNNNTLHSATANTIISNPAAFTCIGTVAAAGSYTFNATLKKVDANTWSFGMQGGLDNVANSYSGYGYKTLSAALTQLSLTTATGVNTFDAGSLSVRYR